MKLRPIKMSRICTQRSFKILNRIELGTGSELNIIGLVTGRNRPTGVAFATKPQLRIDFVTFADNRPREDRCKSFFPRPLHLTIGTCPLPVLAQIAAEQSFAKGWPTNCSAEAITL